MNKVQQIKKKITNFISGIETKFDAKARFRPVFGNSYLLIKIGPGSAYVASPAFQIRRVCQCGGVCGLLFNVSPLIIPWRAELKIRKILPKVDR